jgi:hypothetical protein
VEGTTEVIVTGEGVIMLGVEGQTMAQMLKGEGVVVILSTSQLDPTSPKTSSRTQALMNGLRGLPLQDQCSGNVATAGAPAQLVIL